MEWPRIRLPGWPNGDSAGAAVDFAASAARGREFARLLDPETPVPGVTTGALRPEIAAIAVPSTIDDSNMSGDDFELTAGWGHFGVGQAVMPGQGRVVQRPYAPDELQDLNTTQGSLGETTCDVHLNDGAYWRNVPAAVWDYKLGGYQVLKKWLSYRERAILRRPLNPRRNRPFHHHRPPHRGHPVAYALRPNGACLGESERAMAAPVIRLALYGVAGISFYGEVRGVGLASGQAEASAKYPFLLAEDSALLPSLTRSHSADSSAGLMLRNSTISTSVAGTTMAVTPVRGVRSSSISHSASNDSEVTSIWIARPLFRPSVETALTRQVQHNVAVAIPGECRVPF